MSTGERFQIEPTPPRAGMSTGKKVILGCGIGCAVMVLLCGGLVVGIVWWSANLLLQEPADVRRVSQEIAEVDLPDGLQPKGGIDLKVPFSETHVKVAVYASADDNERLGLVNFSGTNVAFDENQFRKQMDQAFDKKDGAKEDDFVVQQTHNVELTIRGEKVRFRVEEGSTHSGGMLRAMGMFPAQGGMSMLFLQLDAKHHTVEEVEQILRSIK